jgi:cyanophycinase
MLEPGLRTEAAGRRPTGGLIALVGSGEYLPAMEAVDKQLMASAAAARPSPAGPLAVVCIPAAAGGEGDASVDRWAEMGVRHFSRLGASARTARIVDRASADDPRWLPLIEAADLIYFSGGDPLYLYQSLAGSRAWAAVEAACARGAVYAGCSAGAMILGRSVPDVQSPDLALHPAFGRVPAYIVMPHFDMLEHYRPGATALLQGSLSDGQFALGVDENTALVGRPGETWAVLGANTASVLTRDSRRVVSAGQSLTLPEMA